MVDAPLFADGKRLNKFWIRSKYDIDIEMKLPKLVEICGGAANSRYYLSYLITLLLSRHERAATSCKKKNLARVLK